MFKQKIKFKHCDPAGIVYYPRYFEIMNDCVEAFFDEALSWPFEELLETGGVPTAEISAKFTAPSCHGDQLSLRLTIKRLGNSSLSLSTDAECDGELRFKAQSRLVRVDQIGKPDNWPDTVMAKLKNIMEDQNVDY